MDVKAILRPTIVMLQAVGTGYAMETPRRRMSEDRIIHSANIGRSGNANIRNI